MKKILPLLFSIVLTMSCTKDDDGNEVNIRLSNSSEFTYENIIVNTSTGAVSFEDIEAGLTSEYQTFTKAYSYAFVSVDIDETTYTFQPIDYVGETPLPSGNYTYQINVLEVENIIYEISLTLIED